MQWPCNDASPDGMPIMHVNGFPRGKGKFVITEYVPTDEQTGPRFPLLLTTGRILSQYNVGAQTRRTANSPWHPGTSWRSIRTTRQSRRARRRLGEGAEPHGRNQLRAKVPSEGGAGRRLHDVPSSGESGQRRHHRQFGLGDELSRIQSDGGAGCALERSDRMAGTISRIVGTKPAYRDVHRRGGMSAEQPEPEFVGRYFFKQNGVRPCNPKIHFGTTPPTMTQRQERPAPAKMSARSATEPASRWTRKRASRPTSRVNAATEREKSSQELVSGFPHAEAVRF